VEKQMKLQMNKINIIKGLFILAAVVIGILMITLTVIAASAYGQDLSKLEEPLPKPLIIMDKNGEVVSEQYSVKYTAVPLSEIPESLIDAIIAVEDHRFYEHSGIDLIGITRSALKNLRAGSIVGGGSTITQQLAKNLFYTAEQTYSRKIKEAVTAFRIENKFDKDKILELYLNQIYFGEGTWGVQDAAQVYFGKNIQDINLTEAALLAALPKAPTIYSPFQNEEKAKERRNLILKLLYEQQSIDQEVYEKAILEKIDLKDTESPGLRGKFPSYVDYVMDEAMNQYGYSYEELQTRGLIIYTQMDPVVQSAIEETYKMDALFPESSGEIMVQSGTVVLDPSTGGIRGLIGYRGQYFYQGFNRATQLKRQPGSAIKPLAVYGPALEKGYTPNSILKDEKTDFNGYSPSNYNDRYQGRITLSDALIHSTNVPAVALLNEIGIEAGIDFLKKTGIPLHKDDRNLSIALGGFTEGVSPLDMAQAFSVFPNLGSMYTAHAITKITLSSGEVQLEVVEEVVEVMKPENAYTMTQMLMGVISEGTGKNAFLNRPVAGKTGTTELPLTEAFQGISGARDAWFVGYTPELVTAVWVGFDKLDPEHVMVSAGGNHPAKIFQEIMTRALLNTPVSSFIKPKNFREPEKIDNNKKDEDREKPDQKDPEKKKGRKSD
jgi:penicillin-binding protein 2A